MGAQANDYELFAWAPAGPSGTVTVPIPPASAGPHELRYYLANDYVLAATSNAFQVAAKVDASLEGE